MMLGGGALPPLHPPYWPAVGRREILERLIMIIMLGGGALPPLHPPYWPAFGRREILERFGIRPRLYDTTPLYIPLMIRPGYYCYYYYYYHYYHYYHYEPFFGVLSAYPNLPYLLSIWGRIIKGI